MKFQVSNWDAVLNPKAFKKLKQFKIQMQLYIPNQFKIAMQFQMLHQFKILKQLNISVHFTILDQFTKVK
jgi:hypothetical protein